MISRARSARWPWRAVRARISSRMSSRTTAPTIGSATSARASRTGRTTGHETSRSVRGQLLLTSSPGADRDPTGRCRSRVLRRWTGLVRGPINPGISGLMRHAGRHGNDEHAWVRRCAARSGRCGGLLRQRTTRARPTAARRGPARPMSLRLRLRWWVRTRGRGGSPAAGTARPKRADHQPVLSASALCCARSWANTRSW